MRILHVTDSIGAGGGAERNLASVIPFVDARAQQVVHFQPDDTFAPHLRAQGIPVLRLPLTSVSQVAEAAQKLREMARDFDVVHTQTYLANMLGRVSAFGVKPIVTSIQTPPYCHEALATYSRLGRVRATADRMVDIAVSRVNNSFVAVSEFVRTTLIDRVHVSPDRVHVVYNAIDVDAMSPPSAEHRAQMREQLGLAPGDFAIITAGKVCAAKGQHILIEALPLLLARMPTAVLVIAGVGMHLAKLRARAAELGVEDRVRFLGLRTDIASVLGACDAFVLASALEGLSLAVAEAMAMHLPCVISPIPPHHEMAARVAEFEPEHARWMVAPSMEPTAWADRLAYLAENEPLRRALSAGGAKTARRYFSAAETGPQLRKVFETTIARA